MVDIKTEEVNDFISKMKASKRDLEVALDNIVSCKSVEGWEDSNRAAFDIAANGLQKEVESAIAEIENTIRELEIIVAKAEDIRY